MFENKKIKIDQLEFECLVAGDEQNELILLLHGFPESAYVFRNLMQDLASQGYYCVAPNLRGYSKGARPKGRKHYSITYLVNDVLSLAKSSGKTKFHLVGHDWGSAIGWQIAHDHPDKVISWTGLSVPHPQSFFEAILNDLDQKKRSKYIKLFQLPVLPEFKIRSNDFKLLRRLWNEQSEDEIENYLSILKQKGALTAVLNYYRAGYKIIKKARSQQVLGDINVATLFIWGNKDIAVGPAAVRNGHGFMKEEYTYLELDGGHWLIQSHYKEVKNAIVSHINKFK